MGDDYNGSTEGRLWSAVLLTFYVDCAQRNIKPEMLAHLMAQAKSDWVKHICSMIQLDHDFFLSNLERVRKSRFEIGLNPYGIFSSEKDFRSVVFLANQCIGRTPPRSRKRKRKKKKENAKGGFLNG